jgi:hypothetical protein
MAQAEPGRLGVDLEEREGLVSLLRILAAASLGLMLALPKGT